MNTRRTPIAELRPTHGQLSKANERGRRIIPTLQDFMDIPAAVAGVYELTEKEIRQKRSQLYGLNKNNAYGWRWRTLMEKGRGRYHTLLVWRIH